MKKISIFVLCLIISISSLFARGWYIGIEGGCSYSIINTTTGWSNTYNNNGFGVDITVPVEYKFTDWLSINSGFSFLMRSSMYEKYATIGVTEPTLMDQYRRMHFALDFPITVRFSAGSERIRGFIGAGVYLGVRLFDAFSGRATDSNYVLRDVNQVQALSSDANYFDAGLIGEAGISFAPFDNGYLYLLFSYQYGLTSLLRDYKMAAHSYFDGIRGSIGYAFSL